MDWLILLLLVASILVPVVLLYGFAGCHLLFSLDTVPSPLAQPTNLRATMKDVSAITLAWDYLDPPPDPVTFEVELLQDGSPDAITRTGLTERSLEIQSLLEGTTYFARVRATLQNSTSSSSWTDPALSVTTLSYQTIFEAVLTNNGRAYESDTLVQRIEPVPTAPVQAVGRVRLTLRAADDDDILLDRVTLSQAAAAGDPYDAGDSPVEVTTALMIPTNNVVALEVDYVLDQTAPLLVAFDVNPAGPASTRFVSGVSPTVGVCYYGVDLVEAGTMDRTAGYDDRPRIELVERIEVPAETIMP